MWVYRAVPFVEGVDAELEVTSVTPFTIEAYHQLVGQKGSVAEEELFLILGKVQDTFGCVPRAVVEDLASRSGAPVARIWGALTAYPGFQIEEGD